MDKLSNCNSSNSNSNRNSNSSSNKNNNNNNNIIETFDGVRKHNARTIFGILLVIIVADFVMDIVM